MFSKLVRRTHMYLALVLAPWMLMYAVSTMMMNHREFFVERYGAGPVPFHVEREEEAGDLAYDGDPREVAGRILASLDLDGSFGVNRRPDGTLVIARNDLVAPRRITYTPVTRRIVVEKMETRLNAFFERFHRRRGYATGYPVDTVWAGTVDLAIGAMMFWVVSGLWMWWEMKLTRRAGLLAILAGSGLFAIFVFTI